MYIMVANTTSTSSDRNLLAITTIRFCFPPKRIAHAKPIRKTYSSYCISTSTTNGVVVMEALYFTSDFSAAFTNIDHISSFL
jgi:hypothetical protein